MPDKHEVGGSSPLEPTTTLKRIDVIKSVRLYMSLKDRVYVKPDNKVRLKSARNRSDH